MEVACFKQPEVGRHPVPWMEQDHISGNEIGGWDAELASAATHGGLGGDHAAERFDRFFRTVFLDESGNRVDEHNSQDHPAVHPAAECGGDNAGDQKDVNERLVELEQEAFPLRDSFAAADGVGAEAFQASGGLVAGKALPEIAVEQAGDLGGFEMMPAGFLRGFWLFLRHDIPTWLRNTASTTSSECGWWMGFPRSVPAAAALMLQEITTQAV